MPQRRGNLRGKEEEEKMHLDPPNRPQRPRRRPCLPCRLPSRDRRVRQAMKRRMAMMMTLTPNLPEDLTESTGSIERPTAPQRQQQRRAKEAKLEISKEGRKC